VHRVRYGSSHCPGSLSMIKFLPFPALPTAEVAGALNQVVENPETEGIVLEFSGEESDAEAEIELLLHGDKVIDSLRTVLRSIETKPKPLVCHIRGPLRGLALEVALAGHKRFATSDATIELRWPWTDLGLLPALGTVRRLCHLAGLEKSIQLLLFGKPLSAEDIQLANGIGPAGGTEQAESWIKANPNPVQPWDSTDITRTSIFSQTTSNRAVLQSAYLQLRKKLPPEDKAGGWLLQSFHDGLERSFDAALEIERLAFNRARTSVSTGNRIYIRGLKKKAVIRAKQQARGVSSLGILGAGLMGTGIALSSLSKGCSVTLFETDPEAAKRSLDRLEKALSKAIRTKPLSDRLHFTRRIEDLASCDFIVEAVFERFEVKAPVLASAASVVSPQAVIASNTTTFPISKLATAVRDPARFIGTHFFAPVEQMELLEIIVGGQTSEETVNKALGLAATLGKVPIVVKDGPGFYTSRVVMAYVQEALLLLNEGASPSFVDNCARNSGMIIGPLAMADLTSLQLLSDIYRNMIEYRRGAAAESGPALEILSRFLAAGRIGKKSGAGIYDYPSPGERIEWAGLTNWFPRSQKSRSEIEDRLRCIQVVETLHTLREGIISEPETADLASVLGWRYPAFQGGVMRNIESLGADQFERTRRELESKFGARFSLHSSPV
jgi:3-hydroxyacyl-CoA dehydrogenase / enoyl-CoA hydratase / 3-hydroxybutyryl-CoA epimerase